MECYTNMAYVTNERTTKHASTILKALLMGMLIRKGEHEYRMDDLYRLCQVRHNEAGEEVLLVVDFGDGIFLADFVMWCDGVTDAEFIRIGANIVLNEIHHRG